MSDKGLFSSPILEVHTDGGCWGNPGPGAWAFILESESGEIRESGAEIHTTNNRMELCAVINALKTAREKFEGRAVRIHTDSQYVQKGITLWVKNWERNGWRTSTKEAVKNQELWQVLLAQSRSMELTWAWVKGHAGNPRNEACDQMVQEAIKKIEE